MKRFIKLTAVALLGGGMLALSAASTDHLYLWHGGHCTQFSLQDIIYQDATSLGIGDSTFNLADIDSITFTAPSQDLAQADTIYVNYKDGQATVSPANAQGISAEITNADVTLTNDNTDREMVFVLSGSSTQGSLTYNGSYKTTIQLAGLDLSSTSGAALNILCGKRIALELADGTSNSLQDATTDLGQKAALYCKGHMEVSGSGSLTLLGNAKHALSTGEYLLIKKSAGSITITGAASDGIHAGQYFQMNGGELTVSGVTGDAVQAEAKDDGDENDGQLIVKGGTLNLTVTGDDAAALKADSLLTIADGKMTINTSGAADKGLKSKADICIQGGETEIGQSGKYMVIDSDPTYCTAVKASGNLTVSGGSLTINNIAEAGKGLSADGDININQNDATVTLNITANGTGGALDMTRNVTEDDDTQEEEEETPTMGSNRVYVALSTTASSMWTNMYLYSSDGTKIAQLTRTMTIKPTSGSTRTFYYYDFGEDADGGNYYFASDDYTATSGGGGGGMGGGGGWGGGPGGGGGGGGSTTYAIRTTTFTGPIGGSNVYKMINISSSTTKNSTRTFTLMDVASLYSQGTITATGTASTSSSSTMTTANCIKGDQNITIDAGTLTLNNSGTGAKSISCENVLTMNGGSLTVTNSGAGLGSGNTCSTAKGLTSDGSIALNGGELTIKMTGTGAKCIKSDGTLTVGLEDGSGPVLNATTTGSTYSNSSSAKAIKVMGAATIYGGALTVKTSTDGAEGLESKTSVDIRGGQHYFYCYDDCINSSGCIYFNGGITVCYSNGNDAVDSNAGKTGAITIGNGTILAYSTKGSPEEGMDCDNNSYLQITGTGIGISAGGAQGGGSSSSTISNAAQGYTFYTSSISYAKGRYYTLADASGNNLVTYTIPVSLNSSLSLITATGMVKGSTYTLTYSSTEPTDATTQFQGIYLGSSAQGDSSTKKSFTAK